MKSPTLLRLFAGSFVSSTIAELLMTSIIQRILTLLGKDGNEGIKRIFDQGLNAVISGGINIKAYDMLVKEAPNVEGAKWSNHEEFVAQAISDVLGGNSVFLLSCSIVRFKQDKYHAVYG